MEPERMRTLILLLAIWTVTAVEPPATIPAPDPTTAPLTDQLRPRDPTRGNERLWRSLGLDAAQPDLRPRAGAAAPTARAALATTAPTQLTVRSLVVGAAGASASVLLGQQRYIVAAGTVLIDDAGQSYLIQAIDASGVTLVTPAGQQLAVVGGGR